MKIYYWDLRGLCEPIVTLCEFIGIEYELVNGIDREQWYGKLKPGLIESGFLYPNLPYLEDGDYKISECIAIMHYIVKKAKRDDLLFKDYSRFLQIQGVLTDIKLFSTMPMYMSKDLEGLKNSLNPKKNPRFNGTLLKMECLMKERGKNKFLFGNEPNMFDFFFAENMEMALDAIKELKLTEHYPADLLKQLEDYKNEFLKLEAIVTYRKSPKFKARPYNNSMAIWK